MTRSLYAVVILLFCMGAAVAQGRFIPSDPVFDTEPVQCPSRYAPQSVCRRLSENFAYVRPDRGFEASAGLITDGASIPGWAQGFIGRPHDKAFIRAAVLHDHYVRKENAVLSYLATQQLFYWALLDSDVPKDKAMLMYAAVLVGAPKWSLYYRAKPEECDTPMDVECVKNDGDIQADEVVNYTEAAFNQPGFQQAVASLENSPALKSGDLAALEREALGMRALLGLPTPPSAVFGDQ